MATYNLDCCDANGEPCGPAYPMGDPKTRIFDPTGNSKYASLYGAPIELLMYDKVDQLTYLRFGSQYCLTGEDRKSVKKLAKKGGHKLKHAEAFGIQYDTLVVEIAARTRHGDAIAARYFGKNSDYNRTGVPDLMKSDVRALCVCIDIGCQQICEIVERKKRINKVIFMTSSPDVIDIATKIWDWQRDGFPTLPAGVDKDDAFMLHHNFKHLEEANNGIDVMLWKVNQEYLSGAIFDVNCRFDDLHNVPTSCRWDSINNVAIPLIGCFCGDCIHRQQIFEVQFAATGKGCCDCQASRELRAKYGHLKAGDQIPLTNNADMDLKVTMKVDGKGAANVLRSNADARPNTAAETG